MNQLNLIIGLLAWIGIIGLAVMVLEYITHSSKDKSNDQKKSNKNPKIK